MFGADGSPDQPTQVLRPLEAAALADPGARTEVLARPAVGAGPGTTGGPSGAGAEGEPGGTQPTGRAVPLVERQVAAELGVYVGAGLVLLAFLGAALRGWAGWDPTMRGSAVGLTALALVASGLFVRLPWGRRTTAQRRRAVSVLITAGLALAAVGSAAGLHLGQASGGVEGVLQAVAVVLAMAGGCAVARTPLSETGLLGALAWAVWALVPVGPGTWWCLVGLGVAWAGLGLRLARAPRTAVTTGTALALVASVGLAQGQWAWPVRGALLALAVVGLGRFLRGGANGWLALGVGAAMALSGAVAGGALSPALTLMVAGVTTMAVSGLALRGARRTA